MNAISVAPYILKSGILGISLFLALRCLITDDWHREAWRSKFKRRVYVSPCGFKRLTYAIGTLSAIVFLLMLGFVIGNLL